MIKDKQGSTNMRRSKLQGGKGLLRLFMPLMLEPAATHTTTSLDNKHNLFYQDQQNQVANSYTFC